MTNAVLRTAAVLVSTSVGVALLWALRAIPPLPTEPEPVHAELHLASGAATFLPGDSDSEFILDEGTPLYLTIISEDYIYSLRQPELGWNLIAVADIPVEIQMTMETAGRFPITLDPICGFPWKHSQPPTLVVEP